MGKFIPNGFNLFGEHPVSRSHKEDDIETCKWSSMLPLALLRAHMASQFSVRR